MPKKGYKQTEEHLQKNSEATKAKWRNPEYRARVMAAIKKRPPVSMETRKKQSEANKGKVHPLVTEETRRKQSEAAKILWQDSKYRKRVIEAHKAKWQDPKFVQKQMKSRGVSPNVMELIAAEWLNLLGFQFVGDGQLIIAGKCPDFWDGQRGIIELYGDYWHAGQDPQERVELFKTKGYNCLIIWEHELKEDLTAVQARVTSFIESERQNWY